MTIRRGERNCDAADDVSAASDDEGEPLDTLMLNEWKAKDDPLSSSDPVVHPSTTDFGPESLAKFIREEIQKAKVEGRIGKGKGKAAETPCPPSSQASNGVTDAGYVSLAGSVEKTMKQTRLSFAENALRHLRGLRDPPAASLHTSDTRKLPLPNSANMSPPPPNGLPSSYDGLALEELAEYYNRRSIDFEDHSESVRNRNRSETRRTYRDPAYSQDENVSDESSPRPRKTNESLSHLVSVRPSTPDSESLPLSPRRRTARTPGEMRAMFAASGNLTISDEDDDSMPDVNDGSQEQAVADPSSELLATSPSGGSTDESFSDAEIPRNDEGRIYERDSRADLTGMRRELARTARRVPRRPAAGPSEYDYAQCIPPATPRFIPAKQRQNSAKTAPNTPDKSSRPEAAHRRRAASTTAHDSDDTDIAPLKNGSKSTNTDAKPSKRLAMVFDASKPGWCVKDPRPDHPDGNPSDPHPGSEVMTLPGFNYDIWANVTDYLSSEDLKRLRLVNSAFASELVPILFRSVVANFGKSLFSLGEWNARDTVPPPRSVLAKYGKEIHRFGISFDYDTMGLAYAQSKIFTQQETAWYGNYRWPLETYPRYSNLQELEDLVDDNRPLLKNAFANLTAVSELALSLDSGHGWLEGPDISDMALLEARRKKGSKVFGQSFAEDILHTYGRNEYFKWAQRNSINASMKLMAPKTENWRIRRRIREFSRMAVRDYDSFLDQTTQPDFDPYSHTGGQALAQPPQQQNGLQAPAIPGIAGVPAVLIAGNPNAVPQIPPPQPPTSHRPRARGSRHNRYDCNSDRAQERRKRQHTPIPLQWPIIFNCYNIAADVGGRQLVDGKTANPSHFPLVPGHLSEAQVQWLMETVWAQRAFLSAYTTSIITHRPALRQVHTLTIAKMSSNLLSSLAQREFWTSLSGLKRLKILVKPDWRDEHIPGDKFFAANMPINPCLAAGKFAEFLEQHLARLENLSHLTIGYIGGGEHAVGMFARNQHVLPAPITNSPRNWISDHEKKPDPSSMFAFPHIRDLTFENCWFSPCMLETFMEKTRDTSLHTLALDSVSMLARHSTGIDGPLSTIRNGLRCKYEAENWLAEDLPASAVWVDVLDKITPGITMQERKYKAGMIDSELNPPSEREFRGNITRIVLKSCGYAKISGVKGDQFNQNAIVVQLPGGHQPNAGQINLDHNAGIRQSSITDAGLTVRRARFDKVHLKFSEAMDLMGDDNGGAGPTRRRGLALRRSSASQAGSEKGGVMMGICDRDGQEYFGLGTLTQCVHPVEERVLEKMGCTFGWGSVMERWEAVEDGWLEGGTGRFSGVLGVDRTEGVEREAE